MYVSVTHVAIRELDVAAADLVAAPTASNYTHTHTHAHAATGADMIPRPCYACVGTSQTHSIGYAPAASSEVREVVWHRRNVPACAAASHVHAGHWSAARRRVDSAQCADLPHATSLPGPRPTDAHLSSHWGTESDASMLRRGLTCAGRQTGAVRDRNSAQVGGRPDPA